MKLFYKYMKINKKIFLAVMAFALMPITDTWATGEKITVAQAFYTLAHNNNVQKINELKNRGYSLESMDSRGYNPVCMAIMRQDRNAYNTLISQGASRSPDCLKRIPESAYRRFFNVNSNQTSVTATPKQDESILADTPGWLAASALTAGAIATAYIFRGKTDKDSSSGGGGGGGGGGDTPTPTPTPPVQTCPNGTYDSTNKICNCNDGYYNFGDKTACYAPISNCENQTKNTCNTCVNGYILSNNVCYAKIPNCNKQEAGKCTQCSTGYGIHNGDGTVCYRDIENCAIQETNKCEQCISGYDTYGDDAKTQCYKKIEHCNVQVQTACTQCEDGYGTYGDVSASYCYAGNPCTSYPNTIPQRTDGTTECICNYTKGYYGEKENCQLSEDGEYEEGDGNHDKWSNENELYCNSHGKYLGGGICQCYTERGYSGTNTNCTIDECCTSCIEPDYKKDKNNGLCYVNLYCDQDPKQHKEQVGSACVCEDGYIDYNGGCYLRQDCGLNKYQQGDQCVCKDNYDDACENCLPGFNKDELGNCVAPEMECTENWTGSNCDICPVEYQLSEDGLHCGPECASNRRPIRENPNCDLCASGFDKDRNGLCVVTECSSGQDGYIKDEQGNCVCDTANGYVRSRLGICEKKGPDIVGVSDRNINNDIISISYNGAEEEAIHDIYGMKPVEADDDGEGNKVYYGSVYNALSTGGGQTATINIENQNAGANSVYGIYQPHAIYNAAVINRTTANTSATANITINDYSTLSYIYGLYNTDEASGENSKNIYNAFAFGSGQGSTNPSTTNQATAQINISKDKNSSGQIIGIHGVSNITNAYAITSDGTGADAIAAGLINIINDGKGDIIGIEGTSSTARINNALSYLNSAVSKAVSEGTIQVTGKENVYGISAKGSVANSETQFSKSYMMHEAFSSTGNIDVTSRGTNSKAYGIYLTGNNIEADIYNALGYRSTGTITATNLNGGSAYGIWHGIGLYDGEDEEQYYNNTYNAFRSSAKYGDDGSTANGTINVNIEGNNAISQEGIGIYAAGDAFNAYANSGAEVKLEVIGNINITDNSSIGGIILKGIDGNGVTVANAYATGQNMNTTTDVQGNINITVNGKKSGGMGAGIYNTDKVTQETKIINAGLVNDKSNVTGNIEIQSIGLRPLSNIYGIFSVTPDDSSPKYIYNAYYDNDTEIAEGSVTGTIKINATNATLDSTAEYYGIFTNGGRAYNVYSTNENANVKGLIDINVNGSNNTTTAAGMRGVNGAYLYNTGGSNSTINVITNKERSNAYGMMGENSYLTNGGVINVESKSAKAYGLYVKNGTAINAADGVLNVKGATESYGIYALSTNDKETIAQNAGTINLTGGRKNVGIYASGQNVKVQNTGTININGSIYDDICDDGDCGDNVGIILENGAHPFNTSTNNANLFAEDDACDGDDCANNMGIVLENGAQLVNSGSITSNSNIDLSAMGGKVTITEGGSFKTEAAISGNLEVEKDMVLNNFKKQVVLEDALDASDVSQTDVSVASYLYNTGIKANSAGLYNIVLDMKDFSEIATNSSEAAYLEQNYNAEKNTALFNALKAAPTANAANLAKANALGTSFIPNIPEEELKVQRSLNRTMTDELFKDGGEVRKFVGADAMRVGRSNSGTLTGYDINSESMYALYDKQMNNRYRLGLGMSFTQTDTDYNNDSRRKNFNVQAYIPITYKLSNRLTAVSMAEVGYSDGDYTRRVNNQSFKADTSAITYGLLNEMRYKADLGPVNITPYIGLNALGWHQNSIDEGNDAQALHIAATNVFSIESALGLYVDKDIEFNEDNRLNMALGIGYYHEFADPYKGFDAHHSDSIGKYKLKNKIHSNDRGILSAKLKYDYKAFSIYAELLHYLEEEHPTEFDGGLQYHF